MLITQTMHALRVAMHYESFLSLDRAPADGGDPITDGSDALNVPQPTCTNSTLSYALDLNSSTGSSSRTMIILSIDPIVRHTGSRRKRNGGTGDLLDIIIKRCTGCDARSKVPRLIPFLPPPTFLLCSGARFDTASTLYQDWRSLLDNCLNRDRSAGESSHQAFSSFIRDRPTRLLPRLFPR